MAMLADRDAGADQGAARWPSTPPPSSSRARRSIRAARSARSPSSGRTCGSARAPSSAPHAVVDGRHHARRGEPGLPARRRSARSRRISSTAGEPTALVIGDRNTFRECVTVQPRHGRGGGVTRIGYGCLFMANSHVGHDCQVGDGAIIANSRRARRPRRCSRTTCTSAASPRRTSSAASAGSRSSPGSPAWRWTCRRTAPCAGPRAELAGLNAVGLQRAGMTEEQIGRVKQAYKIVFRSNLGLAEAIAQLEAELGGAPEESPHFVAVPRRARSAGITR